MCLGRLIQITHGEQHSLIRARWLTKIFVVGDVISFLLQGAGGGIMASEWAQEESGIISTDQDIAAVFDCHPETVAYVRYDDEDCCNPAERAGEAKNFVRYGR